MLEFEAEDNFGACGVPQYAFTCEPSCQRVPKKWVCCMYKLRPAAASGSTGFEHFLSPSSCRCAGAASRPETGRRDGRKQPS
jgi:hypothetical protein